ncbi:MAG: ornithine--acyl-ACP N-acyltransferase OlsB [Hyphomicrobiales bacterium]|nr:GNAT family N-acetyltransferase [Ahrensia sp. AH-315-G08]PCH47199.1 MAG: ornithine--acyl-ACP N-acyltransferase OlsB [Hyphomicrobiales bacterium]
MKKHCSSPSIKRALQSGCQTPVLGKIGNLETRFARNTAEIHAAQSLRYQVFCEEMGALTDAVSRVQKRERDIYDPYCRHLLALDNSLPENQQIIGTYRLMTGVSARQGAGFYSAQEFHLGKLLSQKAGRNILELGRSCIAKPYRNRRTIELMWQGIWANVLEEKVDYLIGCASFPGTDPEEWRKGFNWLSRYAALDAELDCAPVSQRSFCLATDFESQHNDIRAFASLPPLLKGYLRVGAKVSSHAVIDPHFDTIDVLVVLDVTDIAARFISHFGADASRFAA